MELGFESVGIAPAIAPPGGADFVEWLDRGFHGEMAYLRERQNAYFDPGAVLSGARTLVMLTFNYHTVDPSPAGAEHGRVARYAWGSVDYHDLLHGKLKQLKAELLQFRPTALVRGVVDTAPLLEREYAQLAGLGWRGKNTLLISPTRGSYFFLACLLTSLDLPIDTPMTVDHCGTCTACLDACPTNALVKPNLLDARKCISYLTIELKKQIPIELRPQLGNWIFGCDVCQDVCPWNRFSVSSSEEALRPGNPQGELNSAQLLMLDEKAFRALFVKTPLWRPKRRGILRNAAIVLGNATSPLSPTSIDALCTGLQDVEPLVRGASAWAMGQHRETRFIESLKVRFMEETDSEVRTEIECALRNQEQLKMSAC